MVISLSTASATPTLKELSDALDSIVDWYLLGVKLELEDNELNTIGRNHRGDNERCKHEVLSRWLRSAKYLTWNAVVDALYLMGENNVAREICAKHCSSSTDTSKPSNMREHKESDAKSASDITTGLTGVLSKRPEFQQLSTSEQEELMVTLYDDEKSMKRQFGKLVVQTRDSVEERIKVVKFAGSILALGAYDPAPGERDQSLLDEHSEEIKKAGSISEIFNILSTYWNYLNYEILEVIIKQYGTSEDDERLRKYDEELHKFCKRRIFELPPESNNGNTLSPKQERLRVKLNYRKDITYEHLLQIRGRIAKILNIRLAALILSRVDEGCVQLTFLMPKFVAQEIFPLSCEQTSALSKESVIRLVCAQYIFEVCYNSVYHNT